MDPLQQQIFNQLEFFRSDVVSESTIKSLTANIAFLIKFAEGIKVQHDHIVVTVIDFVQPVGYGSSKMKRMTVSVHNGPHDFTIVVTVVTPAGVNDILNLKAKVDSVVNGVLKINGTQGLGD